jgi:hypothetical protein
VLFCRRQVMVGGGGSGGEKISPTLFCEKPDDNDEHENDESILKFINPVVASYQFPVQSSE